MNLKTLNSLAIRNWETAKLVIWNEIWNLKKHDYAMEKLIKLIKTYILKSTTVNYSTKKKNKHLQPRKSWITSAISVSCKTKENQYNIGKKSNLFGYKKWIY